jgi:hypothetical protein
MRGQEGWGREDVLKNQSGMKDGGWGGLEG